MAEFCWQATCLALQFSPLRVASTLLLPVSFSNRTIRERLNASIARARALRASVAFWTLPPGYLHENFGRLMQQADSFCCVDVHWPTSLEVMAQHYGKGARGFYLYCKEIYQTGKLQARHNLLHTKMLVLDMPGGEAEIWVGSHNFTQYALNGVNLEASVVLTCRKNSGLYRQARAYVEAIREKGECLPFDPARLAEYKALQRGGLGAAGAGEEVEVLPLVGNDILSLRGKTLLLLGDDARELARFGRAEAEKSKLLIRAGDLQTHREYLFEATIQSSGRIDRLDELSYGIDFTPRPYALRRRRFIPYTAYRSKGFGGEALTEFAYWVNLQLREVVGTGTQLEAVNAPPPAWWVKDQQATQAIRSQMASAKMRAASDPARSNQDLFGNLSLDSLDAGLLADQAVQEADLGPPEVRVPRFRKATQGGTARATRAVEGAFTPAILAAAQPIYEAEFQRQFFEEEGVIVRDSGTERELTGGLRAIQQESLLHKRRWRRE